MSAKTINQLATQILNNLTLTEKQVRKFCKDYPNAFDFLRDESLETSVDKMIENMPIEKIRELNSLWEEN